MSDGMIERVARALCKIAGRTHPNEDWRSSYDGKDTGVMLTVMVEHPERWRTYVPAARAAIEAMRNPPRSVIDPIYRQRHECCEESDMDAAWDDAITAALADGATPAKV